MWGKRHCRYKTPDGTPSIRTPSGVFGCYPLVAGSKARQAAALFTEASRRRCPKNFAITEFKEVLPVNRAWGTQGSPQDACRDLLPAPWLYRAPHLPAPVRRSLRGGDRL